MYKPLYPTCIQKGIRFMQWSRKGYAAFCSLHHHVTIGQVENGIADASLTKGKKAVVTVILEETEGVANSCEEKETGGGWEFFLEPLYRWILTGRYVAGVWPVYQLMDIFSCINQEKGTV